MKKTFPAAAALMKHGYVCVEGKNHGTMAILAPALAKEQGISHAFSSRLGGISPAPYDSLNLSWGRRDLAQNVVANFKRFCSDFQFEYNTLAIINYEHGVNVLEVRREAGGRGFDKPPLPPCDALVTNDPGVTLVTSHADCGALFFYDPVRRAIGLAHAGWKGTFGRIGAKVVQRMGELYGSRAEDILCVVGPYICRNCFEVDLPLAQRFASEFCDKDIYIEGENPDKAMLDLERAAAIQLLDCGVPPEQITLMHACTFELSHYFFSYRRDKGETGSMSAFLRLN